MTPNKIIGKIIKYVTAVILTVLLGNAAMSFMTERDTFTNIGGVFLWIVILWGWLQLLWHEFRSKSGSPPTPPETKQ